MCWQLLQHICNCYSVWQDAETRQNMTCPVRVFLWSYRVSPICSLFTALIIKADSAWREQIHSLCFLCCMQLGLKLHIAVAKETTRAYMHVPWACIEPFLHLAKTLTAQTFRLAQTNSYVHKKYNNRIWTHAHSTLAQIWSHIWSTPILQDCKLMNTCWACPSWISAGLHVLV